MKRLVSAISLTLFFLNISLVNPKAANTDGPSASGTFQVSVDDGPTRNIEFTARVGADGTTTGAVTFQDTSPVSQTETNGNNDLNSSDRPFSLRAEFDCLTIEGNKAVMSGTVTESSLERHIGSRLLLVAHDGNTAANPSGRDRLTWGVYRTLKKDWFPTDSERLEDSETSIAWIAIDAERPEDVGMVTNKSDEIGCRTFPFSSFSFIDAKHAHGDIQVRP